MSNYKMQIVRENGKHINPKYDFEGQLDHDHLALLVSNCKMSIAAHREVNLKVLYGSDIPDSVFSKLEKKAREKLKKLKDLEEYFSIILSHD